MFNDASAGRRSPTMDGSSSIEAEIVTGEASEQQLPDLNPVQAPPGSPEMELLGWQPNSLFMANLLAAADEQPPAGLDLHAPAAADKYLPMVDMPPLQPHQLPIPAWQLLPMPEFDQLPPWLRPWYEVVPFLRDYDHQLAAVPEEEEIGAAAAAEEEEEEAGEMRPDQFDAVQALEAREDDRGKRPLLNEVPPPMFTLSDVQDETCILMKKVKLMSFAAWQDQSGLTKMMPKVTATGDGTFGKKIEGFMFEFEKNGKVGLMCLCHGNILTPAEFIKHAGGTPVSDPLTHIQVIVPNIESLLN